jgi:hypothetical protein
MLGDEGLAGRMRDGTITEEDLPRIDELMKSANYGRELGLEAAEDPMLAERQYQSWRSAWAKYYGVKDPGGAGGADEPPLSYQLPDTGAVRDSLRSYYRGWFRRDPSDMEVNYFKGMLDKAIIDGAQRERQAQLQGGGYTQVNPDSLMEEFVRSSPEYRQLFGNKPGGMSEEEYAGTFESQAQQFLGDVADDDAVRAGMISGSTQTTIGRAAMSGKASESSSFQDRLARAAQMIASMT